MSYTFDIVDYGAVADGKTLNTHAIQQAIDACHANGGGRVLCGPGVFLTGALVLKSNVELHLMLGCKILGSTSLDHYQELDAPGFIAANAGEGSSKSLFRAAYADNIAITGPGELNGQGLAFYDAVVPEGGRFFAKPTTARPRLLTLFSCTNVFLEGSAYIDAPCWTIWLIKCQRVQIHRLRVAGDQRMINNDGIDIDACRDVTVSDCICKTSDDCLVIRNITRVCEEPGICENVTVTNCTLDSWCQGVRIGCPGDGIIRNCTLSNLTITSANNGIVFENPRRYLREGTQGTADIHDILISHVTIDCRRTPILLRIEEGIELRRLSHITFSHIRARSGQPITVQGSTQTAIRNIVFDHACVETQGDDAIVCRRCEGVKLNHVELSNEPGVAIRN